MTGSFVALGDGAKSTLQGFAEAYLKVFSPDLAKGLSEAMPLHDPKALIDLLDAVEAQGADEFIVVPATSDPRMLDALTELVASRA